MEFSTCRDEEACFDLAGPEAALAERVEALEAKVDRLSGIEDTLSNAPRWVPVYIGAASAAINHDKIATTADEVFLEEAFGDEVSSGCGGPGPSGEGSWENVETLWFF